MGRMGEVPGRPGELRIKGPGMFPGYLPAGFMPDPFDEDGYLRTGDILEIADDEDQYLRYVDRSKDSGGAGRDEDLGRGTGGLIAGHPKVLERELRADLRGP